MNNITEPDFEEWSLLVCENQQSTEEALKQAYDQGYHLGFRNGAEIDDWYGFIDQDDEEKTRLHAGDESTIEGK